MEMHLSDSDVQCDYTSPSSHNAVIALHLGYKHSFSFFSPLGGQCKEDETPSSSAPCAADIKMEVEEGAVQTDLFSLYLWLYSDLSPPSVHADRLVWDLGTLGTLQIGCYLWMKAMSWLGRKLHLISRVTNV